MKDINPQNFTDIKQNSPGIAIPGLSTGVAIQLLRLDD